MRAGARLVYFLGPRVRCAGVLPVIDGRATADLPRLKAKGVTLRALSQISGGTVLIVAVPPAGDADRARAVGVHQPALLVRRRDAHQALHHVVERHDIAVAGIGGAAALEHIRAAEEGSGRQGQEQQQQRRWWW